MQIHHGLTPLPLQNSTERAERCTAAYVKVTPEHITRLWHKPEWGRDTKIGAAAIEELIQEILVTHSIDTPILIHLLTDETNHVKFPPGWQWLNDGNHRCYCAHQAMLRDPTIKSITAMVIYRYFKTDDDAATFYDTHQGQITRSTAEDHLKSRLNMVPALQRIKAECPFVTFGSVKASSLAYVSMGTVVSSWFNAKAVSGKRCSKEPLETLVKTLTEEDATGIIECLQLCREHWGLTRDTSLRILWKPLTLMCTMRLYQRMVMGLGWDLNVPWQMLSAPYFAKGLAGVTNTNYTDRLVHRTFGKSADRMLCFVEIEDFMRTLWFKAKILNTRKLRLAPLPPWNLG